MAFDACCRLRRVYWHSPVDRLEEAVFAGCPELETVENPMGGPVAWKSIGARAFFNCRSLREICLKQVEEIGNTAFYGTWADLYFVHQVDAAHEEAVFQKGGALDALSELKQEGVIRFAGVASHYYDILLRGARDFRVDVLQASGNLLERGMLERMKAEPLFREKGILINKVYAAGLLPAFFPVETLLGAVLSYPVSCALIGIGTTGQARAAFGSHEKMDQIPGFDQVLSVLDREFSPIPCDRCQRCVCPYGTEIHTVFRQYQYFHLGKEYWALRKLDMGIEQNARRCRQCTEMPCLAMCPAKIRIPDEIEKIYRLVQVYYHPDRHPDNSKAGNESITSKTHKSMV